ncbi:MULTISPECIES: alpha/beta hydrolase [unclassified Aeromicrobium]|uniref:alpha/beta hydrolase n=1 Tax=unclassified Aeromicrobium TaxID=2633570 RepID=UPI00288C0434|nr:MULTISPECIES: alpha/beta hydrolase [unclassified Aeromicrobium]
MSEPGGFFESDPGFRPDPFGDPASTLAGVSTNVCRTAALVPIFEQRPLSVTAESLIALGFEREVRSISLRQREDVFGPLWTRVPDMDGLDEARREAWNRLNREPSRIWALRFLFAVLLSEFERESTTAAVAIMSILDTSGIGGQRQRPNQFVEEFLTNGDALGPAIIDPFFWQDYALTQILESRDSSNFATLRQLATERISISLNSDDPVTVELASAWLMSRDDIDLGRVPHPRARRRRRISGTPRGSTIVHGTFGWSEDWWRPRDSFHSFISADIRRRLYRGGAYFSWSGAYSQAHRLQAGTDFQRWTDEIGAGGLKTVFGHSFGGEVAAIGAILGARLRELVLLSVPVSPAVIIGSSTVERVVDIRLPFDPVLALTGRAQVLPTSVRHVPVQLSKWRLSHSASHRPSVWVEEDVAGRAGL